MLERKVFRRAIVVVMDSVGAGELPDAADFGDKGADTLGNIRDHVGLSMPNLGRLGLSRFVPGIDPDGETQCTGASGRMGERSAGKDTLTGHWEMAGIINKDPFVTFPGGFPPEVIEPFSKAVGRGVIGNKAASGTEIIKELGEEHQRTGDLIVYTSADSVFQIAAHEETVPIEELYRICEEARRQLVGPYNMARVIARPFVGAGPDSYKRTSNRHDYAVNPPAPTLLDMLQDRGGEVIGVGKIRDIYNGNGIGPSHRTTDNAHGIDVTCDLIRKGGDEALLFVNLVDFDMLYGHRRNPGGYRDCLHDFDAAIPRILKTMREDDALFITADHGNDPTFPGTDHTREYAPLVIGGDCIRSADLGDMGSFADLGQTIADNFGFALPVGESMLGKIRA